MQRTITSIQSMYHFEPLSELALMRYSISPNDLAIKFEGEEAESRVDFVLELMEVYHTPDLFDAKHFEKYSIHTLLEYLERTHIFYEETILPKMEQSIHGIIKLFPDHIISYLLNDFFSDYAKELKEHIELEEDTLFPYARRLTQGGKTRDFSVAEFLSLHDMHVESALDDVIKVLESDFPEVVRSFAYRTFKNLLEQFHLDLHIHHMIEEQVFLNRLKELETRLTDFPFQ